MGTLNKRSYPSDCKTYKTGLQLLAIGEGKIKAAIKYHFMLLGCW
jgi:hypothetical protein